LRRWFAANHGTCQEVFIGFYKKASGRPTVTYHEALDEALCVGWIDGVRRSRDADSYVQRFTPRKPKSYWSLVNISRAKALMDSGRMKAPGQAAFEKRDEKAARKYSFEQKAGKLEPDLERRFRAHAAAWEFFEAQPPGYRRMMIWYVMSGKRDETRAKRLDHLMATSAKHRRIEVMKPK
jgi:uncharacterized protein YdeI (YjbR/CyaY-like superfamily)